MRAIHGVIAGVGVALVAVMAMTLLIGDQGSMGSDPAQQSKQAAGSPTRLGDGPTGPAEPVDAAEDTSVGTLPPPPDASLATQLVSRDLVAPPEAAPDSRPARKPAGGRTLAARPAPKPDASDRVPAFPEDFTFTRDGWEWSAWDGARSGDTGRDDCRRDRHHDCDGDDWDGDDWDGWRD
ncbi:hypothetical protein [Nocardioides albus]|uniref:Uncharacterized protein n=1 Tax=Nocardioides albus TaxID=1841 RepID=A0A7W5A0J8_9ACTN|nr:hypothetical protein [Nocardioides albus]MBB3087261.1 hypothetical protein [Nocardioides albus]GGU07788.1 hypothetical protein GCM10007979_01830 [Nocardioides albus]